MCDGRKRKDARAFFGDAETIWYRREGRPDWEKGEEGEEAGLGEGRQVVCCPR
jgi:hypothetical protein